MASLEEAIAGARRGEKWEHFSPTVGIHYSLKVDAGVMRYADTPVAPIDGWTRTRVEEPLHCPRCGEMVEITRGGDPVWRYSCIKCGLSDWTWYCSEASARDAWKRIGEER